MNIAVFTNVILKKDPKGVIYIEDQTGENNKNRIDIYYDKKYKRLAKTPDGTRIKTVTGTFEPEQPINVIFSSTHTNLDNLELGIPLDQADDYGYEPPFLKITKIKFENKNSHMSVFGFLRKKENL